jgi:hypothetical protein
MSKKRSRSHIIADLSVNHVEYHILKRGFSVERIQKDYGYDLQMYSYDNHGEFENGVVYLQLKATDNIEGYEKKRGISYSFSFEGEHLETWLGELMPVILVLFDVSNEIAYWVYVQDYFETQKIRLNPDQKTVTIDFEKSKVVDLQSVSCWKEFKNKILLQLKDIVLKR